MSRRLCHLPDTAAVLLLVLVLLFPTSSPHPAAISPSSATSRTAHDDASSESQSRRPAAALEALVMLLARRTLAPSRGGSLASYPHSIVSPSRRGLLVSAAGMDPSTNGHGDPSSNGNGNGAVASAPTASAPRNVLGGPLRSCCTSPMTGYYRDGFCKTDQTDTGRHVVCAQVTDEFLQYSKSLGNDLMTPAPWYNFPGLKHGDKWCLCAARWREALQAGKAPPVFLRCTHTKALEYVTLEQLKAHALDLQDDEL